LPVAAPDSVETLSPQARVTLLTIKPGSEVYSMFGHSAFRIHDPVHGIDRTYDYGTFRFDDPLFVPKFVYGHLDYMLSTIRFRWAMHHFRETERPVIEQTLRLARADRQALYRLLEINARPANRVYRYDFLFDNCSTRLRDRLEDVLGARLMWGARPDPGLSFRHMLDPYVADRRVLDVGFDLILGLPTDRVVSTREAMFLPDVLMEAADHATVRTPDGQTRPLVARTDTLFWIPGYEGTPRTFPWPAWLAWVGLAVGAGLAAWGARNDRPPCTWPDVVALAVTGGAGLLMAFLWFVSEHHVTDRNLNLAWAWPTHLVAAVLLSRDKRVTGHLRTYLAAAALATLLLALGVPLWPQPLHPAVVPLVLLVAVRCARHAWAPPSTSADEARGEAEPDAAAPVSSQRAEASAS
jgi:hypothetical protein